MSIDHSSFLSLAKQVTQEYPNVPRHRLVAEITRIIEISSNARDLINKRILDLGCGSINTADRGGSLIRFIHQITRNHEALTRFDPWYCRILQIAGANSVGVDIAENDNEKFEHHALDILDPHALDIFKNETFDAVNNYKLTVPRESRQAEKGTSPEIYKNFLIAHKKEDLDSFKEQGAPFYELPAFTFKKNLARMHAVNDRVFTDVQRILKEGGVYTLAEFVFQKKKGRLKKVKTMTGLGS